MPEQTEYRLETVALVTAAIVSRRADSDFRASLPRAAEEALALLDAVSGASQEHFRLKYSLEEGPHISGKDILRNITGIKKRSDARRAYAKYLHWLKSTDLPAFAVSKTDPKIEIVPGPPRRDIPATIAHIERVGASDRWVKMEKEGYNAWWNRELAAVRGKSGSSRRKPKRRWKGETIQKHVQKKFKKALDGFRLADLSI
jgi:hypothetical protein